MLAVDAVAFAQMIGHAYDCYPEEMCGLLAGSNAGGRAMVFYPCRNTTRSGRVFEIHAMDYQRAEDDADARGLELVAIVHSHTHTEPYPSPTDVGVADGLGAWFRWVIVGLKREAPETRSYRITDGVIAEEQLTVT
ncbi:MAG: Mov34/MPN/PAD-1 family protein [Acidimicrobiia bacterium]